MDIQQKATEYAKSMLGEYYNEPYLNGLSVTDKTTGEIAEEHFIAGYEFAVEEFKRIQQQSVKQVK